MRIVENPLFEKFPQDRHHAGTTTPVLLGEQGFGAILQPFCLRKRLRSMQIIAQAPLP
jgi:hypothetical protein